MLKKGIIHTYLIFITNMDIQLYNKPENTINTGTYMYNVVSVLPST